jgi:hypothetical protein
MAHWLSRREMKRVVPAETAMFGSPVPTQIVSNGPVKHAIFGLNAARIYEVPVPAYAEPVRYSVLGKITADYRASGGGRSNLAYGYVHRVRRSAG